MFMDPRHDVHVGRVMLGSIIQTRSMCYTLRQNPRRGQQEVDFWEDEGLINRTRGAMGCHIHPVERTATGHVLMPTLSPTECCESM